MAKIEPVDTNYSAGQLESFELRWKTPGFDKDLGLGVISNKNYLIETPQEVSARRSSM